VDPSPSPTVEVPSGVLAGAPDLAVRAGPYAIRLARLPPGLGLPPHAHEPAALNVVLDGEYREAIEKGVLRSHGPATLIAKPAGAVHSNHLGPGAVECLVIELPSDAVAGVVTHRSAGVARNGGSLRAELVRRDDLTSLDAEALVLELLADLARAPEQRPDRGGRCLTRARDLLHDEPGAASLGSLARRIGLHPVYVARGFARAARPLRWPASGQYA
jgi:hypothetical protein